MRAGVRWSRYFALIAAASLGVGSGQRAAALIVAPPASHNNITAPADDPGWLNVGDNGVYLGNQWVLTANHVGAGTTTFPGVGAFAYDGQFVRLNNPSGTGTVATDLLLYHLSTDPGLPSLNIASSTPVIGSQVTLIGDGRAVTPSDAETHWLVTGTSPNFVWTEVPTGGNAHGYKSTTFTKLWGTNIVEGSVLLPNFGHGDVLTFFTEFDNPMYTSGPTTASEAQAQGGDSGSAVFSKIGATWVLSGITDAVGGFEDQPSPPQTAVYGNLTYIADLSQYRDQIIAVISPVPELSSLLLIGAIAGLTAAITWLKHGAANATAPDARVIGR